MRKRVLHRFCAQFSRDALVAHEDGLSLSRISFAVRLIALDLFPADRGDPIGFTPEGHPVYQFDTGGGWEIEFAEEESPDTSQTIIHLLSLRKRLY